MYYNGCGTPGSIMAVLGESVLIETQNKLKNAESMTDEPGIFLMSEILYKAHYQNDIIAFCLNILGIAML